MRDDELQLILLRKLQEIWPCINPRELFHALRNKMVSHTHYNVMNISDEDNWADPELKHQIPVDPIASRVLLSYGPTSISIDKAREIKLLFGVPVGAPM